MQEKSERTENFDVVVVGAGAAGLIAAIEAADCGARVVVLQKLAEAGGKSSLAIGSISAAGTSMQRAHGIDDDVDAFWVDVERRTDMENVPRESLLKMRTVVRYSGEIVDRLIEIGASFTGPHPEAPGEPPRLHAIAPDVRGFVETLARNARERGVHIRGDWIVDRLVVDGDRRVVGVSGARGATSARGAVVLASGDFSSPSRLSDRSPQGSQLAFRPWSTGDGHFMAAAVGARLFGLDEVLHPEFRSLDWPHIGPNPLLFSVGAKLVNRGGEELPPMTILDGRNLGKNTETEAVLVLDRCGIDAVATASDDSDWARDGWINKDKLYFATYPGIAYAYLEDIERAGYGAFAETSAELASRFQILGGGLASTMRTMKPPFFGCGPLQARALLGRSGVDVDECARVLRDDGTAIGGLFAAGAIAGPTSYGQGHGFGLAWACVSGRIAGVNAASG